MSNGEGNNPLGDIVGNILGGDQKPAGTPKPTTPPPAQSEANNPMGDILGQILGGSAPDPSASSSMPAGNDPLGGILGSILGGGSSPTSSGASAGNDPLGGILGGGNSPTSSGASAGNNPLGGILGSILGGGLGGGDVLGAGAGAMAALILSPIADALAQKLGISKTIAMAVVAFAATKVIGSFMKKQGQPTNQLVDTDLVDRVKAGNASPQYLVNTGMADEIAQQTGLDRDTAARSLQAAFTLVDEQFAH